MRTEAWYYSLTEKKTKEEKHYIENYHRNSCYFYFSCYINIRAVSFWLY